VRTVKYTTYWAYGGKGDKREAPLWDFILDIPYLMENTGAIPPYHVLNEVLQKGGNSGGMGPGTKWRPFSISQEEYNEFLVKMQALDLENIRERHPYVRFSEVVLDEELNMLEDHRQWLKATFAKYYKA
jgi:hypothetical protein